MSIIVEPISDAIGARITGIDLRQDMDEAAFQTVHKAWLDHQVLVFPGQELGEEDQVRFTAHFGELGGASSPCSSMCSSPSTSTTFFASTSKSCLTSVVISFTGAWRFFKSQW